MKKLLYIYPIIFSFFSLSCKKPMKIAYINNEKVFNDFALSQVLSRKLENKRLLAQTTLDSIKIELIDINNKLKTDSTNQELIRKYELTYREYVNKEKQFKIAEEQLVADYDNQILTRLNTIINSYAKKHDFDLILGSGNSNVLFAKQKLDITEELIAYSNKRFERDE